MPSRNQRDALLAAAHREIVLCGPDLQLKDVAIRAKVSVAVAYKIFGTRAKLFVAVITDFFDRYDMLATRDLDPRLRWRDRAYLRLRQIGDFLFSEPSAPVLLSKLRADPAVAAIEAERRSAAVETMETEIRSAQRRGELSPELAPELTAPMLVGAWREAAAAALKDTEPDIWGSEERARHWVQECWALTAAGLRIATEAPRDGYRLH